jgi:hypothetical protein
VFRPIVTILFELIDYIPGTRSLALTVIADSETLDMLRRTIAERYPNVGFDLILADDPERVREVFNNRVIVGRRFG